MMPPLQLTSRAVAPGIQLDSDSIAGIFSDNGFLLLPWEKKTITFKGRSDFKAANLASKLSIMSFADVANGGGLTFF